MAASLNLHRLFHVDDGYLRELRVPERDEQTLRVAREKIRRALKDGFRNWNRYLTKVELAESAPYYAQDRRLPVPKFRLQGSFAYHTANDCQQTPPQQIDQDDGMFLPVSFITANGVVPRISSKAYFKIVDGALAELCKREGWTLNPGGERDKCVRVGINNRLHIDLPLYAIHDEAFQALVEKKAEVAGRRFALDSAADEDTELSEAVYRALGESEIALAHREKGWIGSDPRKLETWFEGVVAEYGPIVRRLSRDFKGLRDAHWTECELSSICIMAAVVRAVVKLHPFTPSRDDLALSAVARELSAIFGSPIDNPVFPGAADKRLCNGWTSEFRAEVQGVFVEAANHLDRAIYNAATKSQAIALATKVFGERVPDDERLITVEGAAAVVRQVDPSPQPKPMVPRTTSG